VNDLRRYWAYAAGDRVCSSDPLVRAREDSLASLVRRVPVYEVGLTADLTRARARELIDQLLARAGVPVRR